MSGTVGLGQQLWKAQFRLPDLVQPRPVVAPGLGDVVAADLDEMSLLVSVWFAAEPGREDRRVELVILGTGDPNRWGSAAHVASFVTKAGFVWHLLAGESLGGGR